MKNQNEARKWFRQALQDLDDARFNISGKRYNIACFLAQQAAEKALKAFLVLSGAEEVWGHSVRDLCEEAQKYDSDFATIESESNSLDKYYIPTRYPNAIPGNNIPSTAFDEFDADRAISLAQKILDFIKSKYGVHLQTNPS